MLLIIEMKGGWRRYVECDDVTTTAGNAVVNFVPRGKARKDQDTVDARDVVAVRIETARRVITILGQPA